LFAVFLMFVPLAWAAPTPPAAKIADMAWMTGYWDGEGFGGQVEDLWMPPRVGMMLGIFRVVKAGKSDSYELMGFEEFEGSLRFVGRRFNPAWEKNRDFTLPLSRIGPNEAVFGVLTLRRTGDDLEIVVDIPERNGNPARKDTLRYKRRPI
jgi:hypothetical protein